MESHHTSLNNKVTLASLFDPVRREAAVKRKYHGSLHRVSFLLGLFRRFGRAKRLQGGCFTGLDRTVAMGLFCWFVSKVVGLLFWTEKLLQGGCFTGLYRNLQWGCFTGLHRNCYKAVGFLI